ncbi:MAG TPA: Ig-like domain-containing protein, partial [Pseudonocardiaceae bacterium]
VQFMDGTTNIGNPMNVFFSNSVSITTTTLAVGSHPLAVKFIPRPSLVNVKGSTSNTVDFVVNGGTAVATTTALVVTPNSPANADTQETLTATVTPPAAGSVQFLDGTTSIGTPVTVSGGTASTTTTLVPGSHSLTAVFTSTDPAFTGSISPPVTYVVNNPAGAQDTTTTLTASPVGPVDPGTAVTLNAALTPGGAAGTVQFLDGTTTIGGPVTVAGGTASTTTSTLTAGSHQLTAEFTPDNPAAFNASTSPAVTLVVNTPTVAMATRTVLVVTPASPVAANTVETLKATLTPSATAGSVQFKDRTTAIGNPVPVTNGSASTTTTLASGTHSLTAVFTPTDPAAFKPSKSRAVSLRVNGPGGGQPLDQAIAKVVTDLKGAIQRQPSLQPFLQPIIQFLQFFIQFVHSGQLLHVGPR